MSLVWSTTENYFHDDDDDDDDDVVEYVLQKSWREEERCCEALKKVWNDVRQSFHACLEEGLFAEEPTCDNLKSSHEVVLNLVKASESEKWPSENCWWHSSLRNDREVALEAVKKNDKALSWASWDLQADRDLVLEAVRRNGGALEWASGDLQADREVVLEAVKRHGEALRWASKDLQADRELVLEAVKQHGEALRWVSEELRGDRQVVLEAVKEEGTALTWALGDFQGDKQFVLEAVRQHGEALLGASKCLKADREIVLEAVKHTHQANVDRLYTMTFTVSSDDKEVLLEFVKQMGELLERASEDLRADREVVLEAVKQHGQALRWASAALFADREVVLEAVKQHGEALLWASQDLRADREVVLEAVKQSGQALEWASIDLQADKEVVLEAVKHDARGLCFASRHLRADKQVVLEAMKQNSSAWRCSWDAHWSYGGGLDCAKDFALAVVQATDVSLSVFCDELQGDPEIAYLVVKRDADELDIVAETLQHDWKLVQVVVEQGKACSCDAEEGVFHGAREHMLAAVSGDGMLLECADAVGKEDEEVVLQAVRSNGMALQYAMGKAKQNRTIVLAAVARDGMSLQFAPPELQADREVVLEAIQSSGCALQFSSANLRNDPDIAHQAVQQNGFALTFAPEDLQCSPDIQLEVLGRMAWTTLLSLSMDMNAIDSDNISLWELHNECKLQSLQAELDRGDHVNIWDESRWVLHPYDSQPHPGCLMLVMQATSSHPLMCTETARPSQSASPSISLFVLVMVVVAGLAFMVGKRLHRLSCDFAWCQQSQADSREPLLDKQDHEQGHLPRAISTCETVPLKRTELGDYASSCGIQSHRLNKGGTKLEEEQPQHIYDMDGNINTDTVEKHVVVRLTRIQERLTNACLEAELGCMHRKLAFLGETGRVARVDGDVAWVEFQDKNLVACLPIACLEQLPPLAKPYSDVSCMLDMDVIESAEPEHHSRNETKSTSSGTGFVIPVVTHDSKVTNKPYLQVERDHCIGEGGFGTVCKAKMTTSAGTKQVAVKHLKPEKQDDFEYLFWKEMLVFTKLTLPGGAPHPYLLRVVAQDPQPQCGIVMELCDTDLKRFLSERRTLLSTRVTLMEQTCDGCAWIASKSYVHRDLKPSNILLQAIGHEGEYHVRIGDFGLAEHIDNCPTDAAGTLLYMAPECIDGFFSEKSDMYSFGLIMLGTFTYLQHLSDCQVQELKGMKNAREVRALEERNQGVVLRGVPAAALEQVPSWLQSAPMIPGGFPTDEVASWICSMLDACPSQRPFFERVCFKLKKLYSSISRPDH